MKQSRQRWRDDQRAAYRELGLLATRRPPESKRWRGYWLVFLPVFAAFILATSILDVRPWSVTSLLFVVGIVVAARVWHSALALLGVVEPRRRRRPPHRAPPP